MVQQLDLLPVHILSLWNISPAVLAGLEQFVIPHSHTYERGHTWFYSFTLEDIVIFCWGGGLNLQYNMSFFLKDCAFISHVK